MFFVAGRIIIQENGHLRRNTARFVPLGRGCAVQYGGAILELEQKSGREK
jgi:hypothetical protein